MNDPKCKNCAHYIQHYALLNEKLCYVYCGHCTFGSPKRKMPHAKICEHFAPGIPDTNRFVTKEYLTKELLRYILDMQLLPTIEEP